MQNVRIHNKVSIPFGFVTFARAESAAKALEKWVHEIEGREVNVAVADSWHQEKPLELCNNRHVTAAQSISDDQLPIELTNTTGTYLLDLNDDCLYAIFSLKLVNIMDLCSVAESSVRLNQVANRIIAASHKCCNFNEISLKTIYEMRRFLINFGSSIEEFTLGPSYDFENKSEGMSVRLLDLVIRYCSKTLQSLELYDYEITEYLTAKLRPMFNKLKKLHIEAGTFYGLGKRLFANCANLVELKVVNVENCTDEMGMIFENHFPKLERFKYKHYYDDYDDYNLEMFVSRHKLLKTFSMEGFNDDCTSLLPVIADNCMTLEKLQIRGNHRCNANQSEYEKALMSLLTLDKLHSLKMNCAEVNVTKFIKKLPKLTSLQLLELCHAKVDTEFIPALTQLKNLNVLRLTCCEDLKNLNQLADLEKLMELSIALRSPTDELNFDLVQMVKRLNNLKKLTLAIAKFKIDKRMYLKLVGVVRGRPGGFPSLKIRSDSIAKDVADLQFDGKNNELVQLDELEDDSSMEESSDYTDDDGDDDDDSDFDIPVGLLLPFLNPHLMLNRLSLFANAETDTDESSAEDDDEENEVW